MYDHRVDRAQDRDGLKRLLRYCARPPFALEGLELLGAERVIDRLPKPQREGTTALTLSPLELIDQLAAQLVHRLAAARRHRHRYHGVLAPNVPLRAAAITFGREVAIGIGLTTGGIAVKLRLMVSLIPYMAPVGLEHQCSPRRPPRIS